MSGRLKRELGTYRFRARKIGGVWLERIEPKPRTFHWVSTERIAEQVMMNGLSKGQHWRISHYGSKEL